MCVVVFVCSVSKMAIIRVMILPCTLLAMVAVVTAVTRKPGNQKGIEKKLKN